MESKSSQFILKSSSWPYWDPPFWPTPFIFASFSNGIEICLIPRPVTLLGSHTIRALTLFGGEGGVSKVVVDVVLERCDVRSSSADSCAGIGHQLAVMSHWSLNSFYISLTCHKSNHFYCTIIAFPNALMLPEPTTQPQFVGVLDHNSQRVDVFRANNPTCWVFYDNSQRVEVSRAKNPTRWGFGS